MMDWAMSRPDFKTQLFRFVDVFPALDGNDDIARHLAEYFDYFLKDAAKPDWMEHGVPYLEKGKRDVTPLFRKSTDGQ